MDSRTDRSLFTLVNPSAQFRMANGGRSLESSLTLSLSLSLKAWESPQDTFTALFGVQGWRGSLWCGRSTIGAGCFATLLTCTRISWPPDWTVRLADEFPASWTSQELLVSLHESLPDLAPHSTRFEPTFAKYLSPCFHHLKSETLRDPPLSKRSCCFFSS